MLQVVGVGERTLSVPLFCFHDRPGTGSRIAGLDSRKIMSM